MRKKISFIIPVFNEEMSLQRLYEEIKSAYNSFLQNYELEIIFIDDGSTDNSLRAIKSLRKADRRIEIISFRKNCGKSLALSESFRKSTGDIIVTIDADLQDDPVNIPLLIKKLNNFDLIVGWRKNRHDAFVKVLSSKIFNYFVRFFSGVPIHDFNSGIKVMKRRVANNLNLTGDLHRFIPLLANKRGFKVGEEVVTHRKRLYGKSKYNFRKVFVSFFDFFKIQYFSSK